MSKAPTKKAAAKKATPKKAPVKVEAPTPDEIRVGLAARGY